MHISALLVRSRRVVPWLSSAPAGRYRRCARPGWRLPCLLVLVLLGVPSGALAADRSDAPPSGDAPLSGDAPPSGWSGAPPPDDRIVDAVLEAGALVIGTPRGVYALTADPLTASGLARDFEAEIDPRSAASTAGLRAGDASAPDGSRTRRSEVWRTVLGRVSVHQLSPSGVAAERRLWIASDGGLFAWDFQRDPSREAELGAPVHGVVEGPEGALWAATSSGLFVRAAGSARWSRSDALRERDVRALHAANDLAGEDHAPELWAATPGALWRLEDGHFRRQLGGLGDGWWELLGLVREGGTTWLGVPDGIWVLEDARARRIPTGSGALSDLAAVGEGGGLALIRDGRLACLAPDKRVRPAAGAGGEALALVRAPAGLRALGPRGARAVLCPSGELSANLPPAGAGRAGSVAHDPLPSPGEVARLHRAVLTYLDLSPTPLRQLERRVRLRGLWPELRVVMGMDARRVRERTRDQTFSSGDVRDLLDEAYDRQRDAGMDLQLVWRLGDLADPADILAISKERRERIELREQVLERVDQIFFERARIRARLLRGQDLSEDERVALELRVRELGAALDAWTGGAFSDPG